MPVTPFCNPYDFFCGGRDEARPCELSHATCNQRTHDAALFPEFQEVEGERIASSIGQRRQMRESLRVIQHADYPEMVESALRFGRINRMEREGNRMARMVEGCDFDSPKIIGFHRPTQLHHFHHQSRKFRHPGDPQPRRAVLRQLEQGRDPPPRDPVPGLPESQHHRRPRRPSAPR